MREKKRIVWSKVAKNDYRNILEYLQSNWGEKITKNFSELVTRTLETIALNPRIGMVIEEYTHIRKLLVLRKTYLFYEFVTEKNEIILHAVWDARRDISQICKFLP